MILTAAEANVLEITHKLRTKTGKKMDLKNFTQVIRELADEKGVGEDKVIETIELAVAAAYKKDYGKKGQVIRARFNAKTGDLLFSQIKLAVDESMVKNEDEIEAEETGRKLYAKEALGKGLGGPSKDREAPTDDAAETETADALKKVRFNPERHIMIGEAKAVKPDIAPGEELEFQLETKSEFGRIASQTAKQVIIQRIREAEREANYAEFKGREGEIVSGIVQRIENRSVFVDLGHGIGVLSAEEQIARERYGIGERIKALLILVEKEARGPGIFLSRSNAKFLAKLFELEVPEIPAGSVEIKAVAREPGSRAKVAAASNDAAIDPVGSMVGQRGVRVSTVIQELGGEKIDIIEWSDDPARFIANALSPAKVLDVELIPERREARVKVPDEQLSLAIGKGGQNVRLAAKLTGWKIDVRSSASGGKAVLAEPENKINETPDLGGESGEKNSKDVNVADETAKMRLDEKAETPPAAKPEESSAAKPKKKKKIKNKSINL